MQDNDSIIGDAFVMPSSFEEKLEEKFEEKFEREFMSRMEKLMDKKVAVPVVLAFAGVLAGGIAGLTQIEVKADEKVRAPPGLAEPLPTWQLRCAVVAWVAWV